MIFYDLCSTAVAAIQWQLFAYPTPTALCRFPVIIAGVRPFSYLS